MSHFYKHIPLGEGGAGEEKAHDLRQKELELSGCDLL